MNQKLQFTITAAVFLTFGYVLASFLHQSDPLPTVRVELAGMGEHSDIPKPFWGTVHTVVSEIEHQGEVVRHGDNFQIFGAYPQVYVVQQKYHLGEMIEDGFTIIAAGRGNISFGQTLGLFSPFDWDSYMEWFEERDQVSFEIK